VEVTLRIATETWRGDLGVGEISPMATGTLVLEYIMIFWWEAVYESVSWRGMEYEYVSRLEMTLMVEDETRSAGDSVWRQVLQS
jgi:hypothetical protein